METPPSPTNSPLSSPRSGPLTPDGRRRYVPAVGPRLKKLLFLVFGLLALLGVNSVYLVSITALEWWTKLTYQDYFYQLMFLIHLVLGAAIILPVVIFGIAHIYNAHNRPNRRAVRAGYALFAVSLALLASGIILTRLEGIFVVRDAKVRSVAYWIHVISPAVVAWLFVLHRLAGRRINWKIGRRWALVAACFAGVMILLHMHDPRKWNQVGPASGERYFFPSLARTSTGGFIPAQTMMNDQYCVQCHADIHRGWSHSVHRFSSFNNPAYLFSVQQTRKAMFVRDKNVQGSRFCAGCHDPVPFFSGAFDHPKFDDPTYDLTSDATAQAGITCTVCHAITNVNSPRGNADFTIEEPLHYPFAFSKNPILSWVNQQLIKAKPAFHKKTFLKPLHKTAEFCSTCHKVHLPEELNKYKFLRGQNHYDTFLLSGVSGHGINSFYYPPVAKQNCNECHMPLATSNDFGAKIYDDSGELKIHGHQFPSANTAIPQLVGMPPEINEGHQNFLKGVMRVDLFGVREGGEIDGKLIAPLRPEAPVLRRGQSYLLETVIRTVKMGHPFTQGTADSNEVWLDVTVKNGDRVIGRIGGMKKDDREVDPWSHFVNVFMLDREGNRIDRRNPEDIFFPLYSHQIPPGATDVVHSLLHVPSDVTGSINVDVKLQYRKFDTQYVKYFQGTKFTTNDLPITTLATDNMTFAVEGVEAQPENKEVAVAPWERWNDYGIGLLRKGETGSNKGELRQAEAAFVEVERLGRPDGPLNLGRVYLKEGRLAEAVDALSRAATCKPPAPPWSVTWFTGQVNKENGHLDEAIANYASVIAMKDTEECRKRGFDFSLDYTLLNELGQALFERAMQERGEASNPGREVLLRRAITYFQKTLEIDPENVSAHYNLARLYAQLGDTTAAKRHEALHAKYKPDDNARDRAIAAARLRYPAANHAAEAVVIYNLQRQGAYELPPESAIAPTRATNATLSANSSNNSVNGSKGSE